MAANTSMAARFCANAMPRPMGISGPFTKFSMTNHPFQTCLSSVFLKNRENIPEDRRRNGVVQEKSFSPYKICAIISSYVVRTGGQSPK